MNKSIHILENKESTRIAPEGRLDESLSPQLEQALARVDESKKMIIDLKKVSSVTPAGVRVLLNASFQQKSGGFSLENPSNEVQQLLVTVGLESLVSTA